MPVNDRIESGGPIFFHPRDRQAISDLSFSHDGEYLAIASAGSYIDIVRAIFLNLLCLFLGGHSTRSVGNSARRKWVCRCIVYLR